MKSLNIEQITREQLIRDLGELLKEADLDVERLEYLPTAGVPELGECVQIIFKQGGTRRVCIEADSHAGIIKDVLRGCM